MDNTSLQMILGLAARHTITTAGGWLISHGYLQSDGLQGFTGAVMIIGGVGWSWWQKRGQALALAELARLRKRSASVGIGPGTAAAIRERMDAKGQTTGL